MESAFNSEPLWSREQFILRPVKDLIELRNLALAIAIETRKFDGAVTSAPDDLMQTILSTIQQILIDDSRPNSILVTFFAACRRASIDPTTCVNAALCLWYKSAIPLVLRDPQHGLPPDSEVEYEDGVAILRWNRDYASEQQHVANLGLVAMVLSLDL